MAPYASLALAGFLGAFYLAAKRTFGNQLQSLQVILAYATVVAFHSIYLELLPEDARPWLLTLIIVAAAFVPAKLIESRDRIFVVPGVALLIIVGIEYNKILFHLVERKQSNDLTVAFAALASLWFVLLRQNDFIKRFDWLYLFFGATHILAIVAFYRLATDQGSLAVSACWLFYAVAVMVLAFTRKDEVMAKSALFVLGLAAGKALVYDAAAAPTIVRIFCLLLTGGVLYGCGFFMRRVSLWAEK